MRSSLAAFVVGAWALVEPSVPMNWNWHLDAICSELQALTDQTAVRPNLLINVPPRSGKSTIVSVLYPAWVWTKKPESRWLFASYAQTLSWRDSVRRRRVIESLWWQQRFGPLRMAGDQNLKSEFENEKTGAMVSTSVGGSVTGRGGDYLVIDDPHQPDQAMSDVQRVATIEWYRAAWSTRKNDPKHANEILIMQRLHQGDLTGYLDEHHGGQWAKLVLPMKHEPEIAATNRGSGFRDPRGTVGELLWPARFGPAEVEDLERKLGPYGTAGQLQQVPAPLGGGWIKRAWLHTWRYSDARGLRHISILDGQYQFDPFDTLRFAIVDPAVTGAQLIGGADTKRKLLDPDYTAIGAFACFPTTRGPVLCLLDVVKERLEGPDIVPRMAALHAHWRFAVIGVESVAYQAMLFQAAQRAGLPVREISTAKPKDDLGGIDEPLWTIDRDKPSRIMAATPFLADGRFFVPEYAPWLADYVSELVNYPVTPHDDQIDMTSMAIAVAEKYRGDSQLLRGGGAGGGAQNGNSAGGEDRRRPSDEDQERGGDPRGRLRGFEFDADTERRILGDLHSGAT